VEFVVHLDVNLDIIRLFDIVQIRGLLFKKKVIHRRGYLNSDVFMGKVVGDQPL
jgi:hypothetical protein